MLGRYVVRAATTGLLVAAWSSHAIAVGPAPAQGYWRAWLDSPGGELPFDLKIDRDGDQWKAWLIDGEQRIEIPDVSWDGETFVLGITQFDSKITAAVADGSLSLQGQWKKRSKKGWTQLPFHAHFAGKYSPGLRFWPHTGGGPSRKMNVAGKWLADFSESDQPYVAVFEQHDDNSVTGTIMTPTGDYGRMAGTILGNRLRLSSFDGAHAFLFDAKLGEDDVLRGDFWSRDTWHETWTAKRNPSAALPDAFKQTKWTGTGKLGDISFPDLTGMPRSLDDPSFRGKARIIEIFGTWCPNCYDASTYLIELQSRYGDRGLSILGIAFELTEDAERNAKQVGKYVKVHGVSYPVLVAGMADKDRVAKVLPVIDELRSYPTTIFLDRNNKCRAVHTGFTGPATGEEYTKLRAKFEAIIEDLLKKD